MKELEREVRTKEDSVALLFRMFTLARAEHDRAYETPHDVALACYLWVLSRVNPEIARLGAGLIRSCYGCWWSRKFADKLLAAADTAPPVRSSGTLLAQASPVKTRASNSTDVGFIFVGPAAVGRGAAPEAHALWVGRQMTLGDLLPRRCAKRNNGSGLLTSDGPARNAGTGDELLLVEEVS